MSEVTSKDDLAIKKMELKASLQETKIREKELTKRVKSENRTEIVKAVLRTGADAVQNVTDSVGAVLQDKDVNVHVTGICKVETKTKDNIETEECKYDVWDPDDAQLYEDSVGSPSNIFS